MNISICTQKTQSSAVYCQLILFTSEMPGMLITITLFQVQCPSTLINLTPLNHDSLSVGKHSCVFVVPK